MALSLPNQTPSSEPGKPVRSIPIPTQMAASRRASDWGARWFVTLGGVLIITSILAILLVIVLKAYPLFVPPSLMLSKTLAPQAQEASLAETCLAIGVGDYLEVGWMATPTGVRLLDWTNRRSWPEVRPDALVDAHIVRAFASSNRHLALGLSNGCMIPLEIGYDLAFSQDEHGERVRTVTPHATALGPIQVLAKPMPLDLFTYCHLENGALVAAVTGPHQLTLAKVKERKALTGGVTSKVSRVSFEVHTEGTLTALSVDPTAEILYAGTSRGRLLRWDLVEFENPKLEADLQANTGAAIQTLGFLNGGRTLITGGADGSVSTWHYVREPGREVYVLSKLYDFTPHAGAVTCTTFSLRNRGFATLDNAGMLMIRYGTTGQTQLKLDVGKDSTAVSYSPKADALVIGDSRGGSRLYALHNPHPEVGTFGSLFGRIWYEGYEKPGFAWQSSGATDDAEPKLSLLPLLLGTLKGTFYAMLFAVPIALLSALYTSQFMHRTLKTYVKPTVEVMAALPSVVLGFIGGLWLAPNVERLLPSIAFGLLITPALILSALLIWRLFPLRARAKVKPGTEILLLIPVILVSAALAHAVGCWWEDAFLSASHTGDYKRWLLDCFHVQYDQRNSIVVGFAMGFAIIPIVFTIAEDALANVPPHLTAGSLALGASRWQTAVRVVLPTASPGIFSAIMIGFGRAVGETMIVLMATGNTPIMDWSIFNGFRALSANIAVELPEAPQDGTLYRLLFLTALMLFAMTFMVNTVAEVVRLRLRKRYRAI